MPKFLIKWLVTAATILAIPHLVSGIYIDGLGTAFAVAAVLALLNLIIRPILILITFPLTLFTFGFFLLVINAFLFKLAGQFVMGFAVDSFGSAFLASLILSFVSWVCQLSLNRESGKVHFEFYRPQKKERVVDLHMDQEGKWK
jgi:putative membrane protein